MARALADVVTMDAENGLLARDIAMIDLRLQDRVVVRLTDEAALRRKAGTPDAGARRRSGADT